MNESRLFEIIGRQAVQISLLREENARLAAENAELKLAAQAVLSENASDRPNGAAASA